MSQITPFTRFFSFHQLGVGKSGWVLPTVVSLRVYVSKINKLVLGLGSHVFIAQAVSTVGMVAFHLHDLGTEH